MKRRDCFKWYTIAMKHLDLFSGYGGFSVACEQVDIETVGFSEIDKYASQVLAFNFPGIKNYGDITKIDFRQFSGKVDLITGGSPCQDLSVAGKQAGLSGKRSGLFFEFIRAITECKPRYFIWENVKGALSSSQGWDFARVQIEMAEAGYSVQWVVLNAKDYGVPQNRERIFAIGTREECGREILSLAEDSREDLEELTSGVSDAQRIYSTKLGKSLKALGGGLGAKTGLYAIDITRRGSQMYRRRQDNKVSAITATYYKGIGNAERPGVLEAHAIPNRDTLLKCHARIRRLTPKECERLMGIPDGWTSCGGKISDTQRYKMCGNGVVPSCVVPLLRSLV